MPDYNTPAINTLIAKSLPVDADAMLLEDSANLWQKKKVLISSLILNNVLRGILGVASGWDTDPTNLANMTDGDLATVTGTGSKVVWVAEDYGRIVFDLGSIKTVLVGGRVGIWSTAGGITAYVESSDDNVNWKRTYVAVFWAYSSGEYVIYTQGHLATGRYIQIRFYVDAAATAYAKIYEVMAWELTI